jgi:hypothetical protein
MGVAFRSFSAIVFAPARRSIFTSHKSICPPASVDPIKKYVPGATPENVAFPVASALTPATLDALIAFAAVWQLGDRCAHANTIALYGAVPAGTGNPAFVNTLSKLSRNKTKARPAKGFAPPAGAAANPLVNPNTAFPGATAPAGIAAGFTAPAAPADPEPFEAVVIAAAPAGAASGAPGTKIPSGQFISNGANVKSPSSFCPVILRPCTK